MIWIRRLFTLPLGLLLFVALLVALVLLQVSDSFLNPRYYPDELRKADIYRFALVDVATSALDEARALEPDGLPEMLDQNPLVTLGLSTEEIVSALNRAIPPEWVQSIVEQAFEELGRYVAGERDEFEVTVMAGDQVVTVVSEVKALLRKADAYNLVYEEVVTPAIEDALDRKLPFGLELTADQLVASVRRVAAPEWVQAQVEAVLDEVTPYFVGERDTFEIRIELSDRVDIALQEVKRLLRETDAYDLLYDEVVEPAIEDRLGEDIELPFGISVTREEVLSALRRVAPPEWVQEQAESVIDQASPYLTGKEDALAITVDLSKNKREARSVIAETAARKFQEAVDSLPTCTSAEQEARLASGGLRSLPECMPRGGQERRFVERSVDRLLGEVVAAVDPFLLGAIPDNITFTDAMLRDELQRAGAEENIALVDKVRGIIRDGWTYTDGDLRRDLLEVGGDEAVQALDDMRSFLAEGWTYTERDLREDIAGAGDASALKNFDRGREVLRAARTWRFLIYLPVALLLVLIGFLGGRTWPQRVAWAAAFLVIAAGLIFVVSGPVHDSTADLWKDELRERAHSDIALNSEFKNTESMVIEKVLDMVESVADGFMLGIAGKSLGLLVAGLIALGASIFWASLVELARNLGLWRSGG